MAKIVFPLMGCILLKQSGAPDCFLYFLMVIVVYSLVDTVSYLLSLIVMADIQRPSANVILFGYFAGHMKQREFKS